MLALCHTRRTNHRCSICTESSLVCLWPSPLGSSSSSPPFRTLRRSSCQKRSHGRGSVSGKSLYSKRNLQAVRALRAFGATGPQSTHSSGHGRSGNHRPSPRILRPWSQDGLYRQQCQTAPIELRSRARCQSKKNWHLGVCKMAHRCTCSIVTFGCKSYRSVAIGNLDMPRWCDTPIVATIAQDSAIDIAELR